MTVRNEKNRNSNRNVYIKRTMKQVVRVRAFTISSFARQVSLMSSIKMFLQIASGFCFLLLPFLFVSFA